MESISRSLTEKEGKPALARELWFTAGEGELEALRSEVEQHKLVSTVRLGDRSADTEDPKGGYEEGRFITLKLQKPDRTFDAFEKEAVVRSVTKKRFGDITPEDLSAAFFDGKTKEKIGEHLAAVYGRAVEEDDMITLVTFEHEDALRNADDLLRNKVESFQIDVH